MALRKINGDLAQWALVVLGLGGFGLVWLSTSTYGPGLSSDSIHYIYAARSVMAGDGYLAFGGAPYIGWPPLFPSALAGLGKIGLDPLEGVRVLNASVYGMTVCSAGYLLRTHLKSSWLAVATAATLLVSLTLVRVSIMAWSEPLLVLLAILSVVFLTRFIREPRLTFFLSAAGCSALAVLDRYIGFSMAIAGSGAILLLLTAIPWQRRAVYAGIFGAVSLAPLALWLVRNQRVSDSFTGSRASPEAGFFENLADALAEFSSWLLPSHYVSSSGTHTALVALAVVALAAIVGYLVWAKLARGAHEELLQLAPSGIFALVYTGSLVILASFVGFDTIGGRLLSPVYVFVLLFAAVSIEEVVRALNRPTLHRRLVERAMSVIGVVLVLSAVAVVFGRVDHQACGSDAGNQLFLAKICTAHGAFQSWGTTIVWLIGLLTFSMGIGLASLRQKKWIGRVAISGIISIWLLYPVLQTGVYVKTRIESGAGGFNSDRWRDSPLVERLRLSPLEGTVYSNVPQILYILTETANTRPPLILPESSRNLGDESTDPAYLVWMEQGEFRSSQSYKDAASRYTLVKQAIFPDGGIFLIKK